MTNADPVVIPAPPPRRGIWANDYQLSGLPEWRICAVCRCLAPDAVTGCVNGCKNVLKWIKGIWFNLLIGTIFDWSHSIVLHSKNVSVHGTLKWFNPAIISTLSWSHPGTI